MFILELNYEGTHFIDAVYILMSQFVQCDIKAS